MYERALIEDLLPAEAPAEIKSDPRHIDGLIAWLEIRNPEESYDWGSSTDCLMMRYAKEAIGITSIGAWNDIAYDMSAMTVSPLAFISPSDYFMGEIVFSGIQDMGHALQRARAYKARHNL